MATSSSSSSSSGIGFCGALAILFIALKLTGVITWSWWWVLAPVWIPWAFLIVGFFVYLGVKAYQERRRRLAEPEARLKAQREAMIKEFKQDVSARVDDQVNQYLTRKSIPRS